MAIRIALQPLSVADILTTQAIGFVSTSAPTLVDFGMRPVRTAP